MGRPAGAGSGAPGLRYLLSDLPGADEKFNGYKCTEKHVFQETYEPDRKDVYIVKEVSGQGAVYDTRMFGDELRI